MYDFLIIGLADAYTGVNGDPGDVVLANGIDLARPNPFRATTEISYSVVEPGKVSLRIYDVGGRLVRTLVDGRIEAGRHRILWEGRNAGGTKVSAGVYFARFTTSGFTQVRRLTLIR